MRSRLCIAVLLPLILGLPGCREEESADQGAAQPVVNEYTVRGEIEQLPDAESGQQLRIHHEPIGTFTNKEGELVGMQEMTMNFPLGEGVDLTEFEVGDKVEFTMVVDWDPGWYIKAITKLPPETELFNIVGPAELGG